MYTKKKKKKLPVYLVLIMLLLVAPLAGVDCNETGDFLRGPESRTFASAVVTEISAGIVDAFIIATTQAFLGSTGP